MTAAEPPLRVIVADDQASVREGLVLLLDGLPDIEVVGAAADGEQAVELSTVDAGYGLTGMRERLRLLGGILEAGRDGTCWVVTAQVPLSPSN